MSIINKEGKIGPPKIGSEGERWMELFTHTIDEIMRRGVIPPGVLHENSVPRPTFPDVPKGYAIFRGDEPDLGRYPLIKLGKHVHMKNMFEQGRIRIAPASAYSDPSLNQAIRDDELSIYSVIPRDEAIVIVKNKWTGNEEQLRLHGDVKHTVRSGTNFYVYCMSGLYSYRLLDDFEADSMVVITNTDQFKKRLKNAAREQLRDYIEYDGRVVYVDPYHPPSGRMQPFTAKHFRYTYQKEYRFLWIPKSPQEKLDPIFVELGSLRDVADFYTMSDEGTMKKE